MFKDNGFFNFLFGAPHPDGGYDEIGGVPLYNCPSPDTSLGDMPHPTVIFTFMITGVVSFLAFIFITIKYNSVRVFNKKIRTNEISNTLWLLFYLFLGIRCVLDAVRYGLNVVNDLESTVNMGLYFSSLVLDGVIFLFLTLSLNHQLRHRSSPKPPPQQRQGSTKSPGKNRNAQDPGDADNYARVRLSFLAVLSLESFFFILFVLHLVFLYLNVHNESEVFYWLYISAFILQLIPIIVLTFFIVFYPAANDGPSKLARYILLIGTLFFISVFAPTSILTDWFLGGPCSTDCQACPFYIGSWVDFLQWVKIISLLFYFFFIRSEYRRNMEECIWTTVSQIQDTFDFRRF